MIYVCLILPGWRRIAQELLQLLAWFIGYHKNEAWRGVDLDVVERISTREYLF